MSPENKQRLEKYRKNYNLWINDKTSTGDFKHEVLEIMQSEIPGYTCMIWCGVCAAKMLEDAFKLADNDR